jgi:uncharacterized protein with ParB-like and HNH nuclease domain
MLNSIDKKNLILTFKKNEMSYIAKTIGEIITESLNRNTFLPAIQREFVWSTSQIERLFDSLLGDYPISSFLFWKIREETKNQWTTYEFIRDFDTDNKHNKEANLAGVNQDIYLVLDGQQRLSSLYIGLKGSYRYFYYRWNKTKLYLNLLKEPTNNDNPEELTYQFKFRENENSNPESKNPEFWFLVGDILNFEDAEDAKKAIKMQIQDLPDNLKENANTLLGRLHSRIHITRNINYYEEKSQDYDKVVEVFIRANTGGTRLEYSDILLSTATAKWKELNAREEIHNFTDEINSIGSGYSFGKDIVLKGCLYLTDDLPIQYKLRNFNKQNLEKIEENWDNIKIGISEAVKLVNKFGFSDKNLVSKIAILPIALYLNKIKNPKFLASTDIKDVENQLSIQKWFIISLLKNVFGSASDNKLKTLKDTLNLETNLNGFPVYSMNIAAGVESSFSDSEIENLLMTNYSTRYSFLILSLLYPDRDWKDKVYHEDHIFPKSEFSESKLTNRGYEISKVRDYQKYFNSIYNMQLITDTENLEKSASPFNDWIITRDNNFKDRHSIPEMASYNFDSFLDFIQARRSLLVQKLKLIKE